MSDGGLAFYSDTETYRNLQVRRWGLSCCSGRLVGDNAGNRSLQFRDEVALKPWMLFYPCVVAPGRVGKHKGGWRIRLPILDNFSEWGPRAQMAFHCVFSNDQTKANFPEFTKAPVMPCFPADVRGGGRSEPLALYPGKQNAVGRIDTRRSS